MPDPIAEQLAVIERRLGEIVGRLDSPAAPVQRFFTVAQAAVYSGQSRRSVERLLAGGKLQAHRPTKGRVLIDRHELDALVLSATARPRIGRGLAR